MVRGKPRYLQGIIQGEFLIRYIENRQSNHRLNGITK